MCTAVVRLDPDSAWPILVAFVRDEERARAADAPALWWPDYPTAFGARDTRAGGTWLAVDVATATIAFVQNQIGPHVTYPDAARSPSRGQLPFRALRDAARDLVSLDGLELYQPFHAVAATATEARWWQWSGSELAGVDLQPGIHLVASRGIDLPGERERRATHLARFAQTDDPDPALELDPADAWGEWIALLDGRDATPGDLGGIVLHSVPERPEFGTVGATLVGIAADGRIRYDVNDSTSVSPDAWSQVRVASASMSA